jgi:hypothetical protein
MVTQTIRGFTASTEEVLSLIESQHGLTEDEELIVRYALTLLVNKMESYHVPNPASTRPLPRWRSTCR